MNWLRGYVDHPFLLVLAICVAIPILWQYWQWLFGGIHNFVEDVKDAAAPDWYAFLRGRYWEGEWAELKIVVFMLLCVGLAAALYTMAVKVLF